MQVAIVDDSAADIEYLYDNICRYCREHKVHIQIERYDNEQEFLSGLKEKAYDLVILDIYMNRINGDRIAEFVRDKYPKCQIIFITASRDYAVKAFKVRALDYLVKPYKYEELESALDRFEEVYDKFIHYIELKEGRQYTRIVITDIMYVDYHNHYIQVHTTSNVVRSYMPFDKFAPMLQPYHQFLWCYRNCMVNMDYIDSLEDKDFVLTDGKRIPISRALYQEVTQSYANYMFEYVSRGSSVWT